HIEIYIAIIFVVILLLIYFSNFNNKKETKTEQCNELTITSYVEDLQNNLEDILSNIGGVSNVKVLITLDMSQVQVENSKIVLSTFPPLKGVIVTAKGVTDTSIKLKVLHAIETAIDVTNGNVEILASN
ncbi:MAG: hypothetical protein MJ152_03590, partial [Clostridia bacterium]|nr:hypothetical protein [Clostridia bacterium]